MKLTAHTKEFALHPEHVGPAVCVDCTPPRMVDTPFGQKQKFNIVFETEALREDGTRFCVWSPGFTASLNEKSSLRKFLRSWLGRDLTLAEQQEFDLESLIGRTANLTIVHNQVQDGRTFANIALIRPDKSPNPLKPSGKFVRKQDRQQRDADSNYQRAEQPTSNSSRPADDWRFVKVHVGKHNGLELCELDIEAVRSLHDRWLPTAKNLAKPLKADRDLMEALVKAAAELGFEQPEADEIPY